MKRGSVLAALLVMEAIVIALAVPVAITIYDRDVTVATSVGLGLAVFAVVVSGLQRRPYGVALGWVVQALAIALGLFVPVMAVLGGIFALLWWLVLWLNRKVEDQQAAWRQADPDPEPEPKRPSPSP